MRLLLGLDKQTKAQLTGISCKAAEGGYERFMTQGPRETANMLRKSEQVLLFKTQILNRWLAESDTQGGGSSDRNFSSGMLQQGTAKAMSGACFGLALFKALGIFITSLLREVAWWQASHFLLRHKGNQRTWDLVTFHLPFLLKSKQETLWEQSVSALQVLVAQTEKEENGVR